MRWMERLGGMLPRGREGDVCGAKCDEKDKRSLFKAVSRQRLEWRSSCRYRRI